MSRLGLLVFVVLVAVSLGEEYCSEISYFRCDSGVCILKQYMCDGEDDCGDSSDEHLCAPHECAANGNEFMCHNGRQCIPDAWKCDGEFDCEDHSDESECSAMTCASYQFACLVNGSNSCIPSSWHCDGHADCPSGEDEHDCHNIECTANEHQCPADGHCISSRWVCDGDADCHDGSDEANCPPVTCAPNQWQCNNTQCIPTTWQCDGSYDCVDRSDEADCPVGSGHPAAGDTCHMDGEFQCRKTGDCIHHSWVCDGSQDCEDGSDEADCASTTCLPHYFQCHSHHLCIPDSLRCDGKDHCGDNSDELGCGPIRQVCDKRTEFDCSLMESDNCISLAVVCDGIPHCHSREDEAIGLCEGRTNRSSDCETNNGGCAHECIATYNGHYCECREGFKIDTDGLHCSDINECELPDHCSQICQNRDGGFKCSCRPGYQLDPINHMTCHVIDGEPTLLFSNRHDLRQLHLYTGRYRSVISGMHSAIAVDYDIHSNVLFWTDITSENISRVALDSSGLPGTHEVLVSEDISTPDGLAYDWINHNLYWTDAGKDRIEVLSMYKNSSNMWRKTLISTGLDEPRAIVIDPRAKHRLMYWTDWGKVPKIERAFMDGTDRRDLITENIEWPNGLTIDYESNQLFWVDAKLHIISMAGFSGNNRQVLLTSYSYLIHPFSITVFEDEVYWTDWRLQAIYKVNRLHPFGNASVHQVAGDLVTPMDLRIHHKVKQPLEPSVCSAAKCSHICLPTPRYVSYTCACPDNRQGLSYVLGPDGKTCIASNEIQVPSVSTTRQPEMSPNVLQSKGSQSNTVIIAVCVSVVVCILAFILVILMILRRYHRMKNVKSLNFDNPVYRKTTAGEETFTLEKHLYQPTFQNTTRHHSPLLQPLTAPVSSSDSSPCV